MKKSRRAIWAVALLAAAVGGGTARADRGGPEALCQGTYVGAFADGERAVMTFRVTGYDQVSVHVWIGGRETFLASGSCQDYGGSAPVALTRHSDGATYRGTILALGGTAASFDGTDGSGRAFHLARQ